MKWIKFLLGLCDHQWEVINKHYLYHRETASIPYGTKYVQQCKKCGKIKKVEI